MNVALAAQDLDAVETISKIGLPLYLIIFLSGLSVYVIRQLMPHLIAWAIAATAHAKASTESMPRLEKAIEKIAEGMPTLTRINTTVEKIDRDVGELIDRGKGKHA